MGRSKEMGKPVDQLTPRELRKEFARCQELSELYGNKPAGKALRKRLLKIRSRLEEIDG